MESIPQHSFSSTAHYGTPLGILKFEIKSRLGRLLHAFSRNPSPKELLNLGCGTNPPPDFTNVDFYCFTKKAPFIQHDLRYPLPFRDGTFKGVFSSHTIEHLYPVHAQNLFSETYRLLRPKGVFRCIAPDLAQYVALYNKQPVDPEFSKFANGCEAIWAVTQNWGHLSVWDAEMLTCKLREAGFERVEICGFRQGQLPELLIDLEERRWESLCVEAYKS